MRRGQGKLGEATIKESLMVHQGGQCEVRRSINYYNLAVAGRNMATVKEDLTVCHGRGGE